MKNPLLNWLIFGLGYVVGSFLFPSLAFGQPRLTADPQPKGEVATYIVTLDGVPQPASPALDLGDGTVELDEDMAGVSVGSHTVTAKACNLWGDCGADSAPFLFERKLPGPPENMVLSVE